MTTTDDQGQPDHHQHTKEDAEQYRAAPDAANDDGPSGQQTVSLNTQQAAQQLGVDSRTVRRYISDGIRITSLAPAPAAAGGGTNITTATVLRLKARQVRTNRGPEWQIYQNDLEDFKEYRDRQATEGSAPAAAGQFTTTTTTAIRAAEESQSQAAALTTTSINIIAAELERRSVALAQAQETIERLAHEAGRQAGRAEQLERELEATRKHAAELEQERDQWRQKAQEQPQPPSSPAKKPPRRIRLLGWGSGNKDTRNDDN